MMVMRVLAGLAGGILVVAAALGIVASGWAVALFGTDGVHEVPVVEATTPEAAIYANRFDVDPAPFVPDGVFDTQVVATTDAQQALFLGVAKPNEVANFLLGVPYDAVAQLVAGAFELLPVPGTAGSAPAPETSDIWRISAVGNPASLPWAASEGEDVLVLMNADGSRGVQATITATLSIESYTLYLVALVGVSLVASLLGARLLAAAFRRRKPSRS